MKLILSFFSVLVVSMGATAANKKIPARGASEVQLEKMALHNQAMAQMEFLNPMSSPFSIASAPTPRLPFAGYNKVGYLIFSDDYINGNARQIKKTLAQNLPSDVTLVVYTDSTDKSYQKSLMKEYSQFLKGNKMVVLQLKGGSDYFWARDGVPVPVMEMKTDGTNGLSLVDAKYYHHFEGDKYFSEAFGATLVSHSYYHEGGNFQSSADGRCLVINREGHFVSHTASIPDDIFVTKYGCKTLTRLPHRKGIGHVDEVVKIIDDNTVVTEVAEYRPALEKSGYKVHLLPEPDEAIETYANSLIINGTIFVPVFDEVNDQKALDVYKQFGFNVIGVNSKDLSNDGQGSIHCISMAYPPVPLKELSNIMGGTVVEP
ncbi:MAG: agmatine deiminase family protein [Bdellovibrionales bacterium]|nr:agmatine deiminase family protein [Bdellovibrionales bacterium]